MMYGTDNSGKNKEVEKDKGQRKNSLHALKNFPKISLRIRQRMMDE
jgi:hypothetical protein